MASDTEPTTAAPKIVFRLDPRKTEWLDIAPGLRFEVSRRYTTVLANSRRYVGERLDANPALDPAEEFVFGLARHAVLAWEGAGDDQGNPIPVTPDDVQRLLEQHPAAFDGFDAAYVGPLVAKVNGARS